MIKKEDIIARAASLRFSLGEMHSYMSVFTAGVVVGFIGKRFFSLVVLSVLVALFMVKGLESQNVLKIDWAAITSYFGVDISLSLNELFGDVYRLAVENIYLTGTAVVGFLIGYRAG